MQIGMVGLGRMGANMVRRLLKQGHDCVVFDVNADNVDALVKEGATDASSPADLIAKLAAPRAVWLMLPAAITPKIARDFASKLNKGDAIIDGGNSFYREAIDLWRVFPWDRLYRRRYIGWRVGPGTWLFPYDRWPAGGCEASGSDFCVARARCRSAH